MSRLNPPVSVISLTEQNRLFQFMQDWIAYGSPDEQREKFHFLLATVSPRVSSFCHPSAYFRGHRLRISVIQYCINVCPHLSGPGRLMEFLQILGVTGNLTDSRSRQITVNHVYQWDVLFPSGRLKGNPKVLGFPTVRDLLSHWINEQDFANELLTDLELGVYDQ